MVSSLTSKINNMDKIKEKEAINSELAEKLERIAFILKIIAIFFL